MVSEVRIPYPSFWGEGIPWSGSPAPELGEGFPWSGFLVPVLVEGFLWSGFLSTDLGKGFPCYFQFLTKIFGKMFGRFRRK
jgi:hypothetical protein